MRIGWAVILGFMLLQFYEETIANAVVGPFKNQLTPEVSFVLAEFSLFNLLDSGEQVFVPRREVPHGISTGVG